jgi:hypothetical protein
MRIFARTLALVACLSVSACEIIKSGKTPTSPSNANDVGAPGTNPNIVMGTEFRRRPDYSESGLRMTQVVQVRIVGEVTAGLEERLDPNTSPAGQPSNAETVVAIFLRNYSRECHQGPANWVPLDTQTNYNNATPTPHTNVTTFRDVATCGKIDHELWALTNKGRKVRHKLDSTNITFAGGSNVRIVSVDGHKRFRSENLPTVPAPE